MFAKSLTPSLASITISAALVLLSSLVSAQSTNNFSIPRISQAPTIDGVVEDNEWTAATRIPINVEIAPGDNVEAEVFAEALLMEDGEVLYVAFVAEDPDPSQIRAIYRDRDSAWNDDWIGIILDTFNDERRAFEFFVNPLGVQIDAIYDDVNGREDSSWNAIWDSVGQISDAGYVVELSIPLKQLRFEETDSIQTWGIDITRNYPRNRDTRMRSQAMDRDVSCYLCQISKLDGFENLESSRILEIIPTVTASSTENRDPAEGDWQREDFDPQASLDLRWGITQDIYLNATVNPDFSQVEADSTQLDVNNTFSLFFPERRTFFLDGADYFDTYENLVHTRNIASPEYGLKLTGKTGDHTYGVMAANDETTSFIIPNSLRSRIASIDDMKSKVAISRYRMDIFENSAIGALVTDRRGDGYSNTVASIDASLRPTDSDTITIQSMYSRSDYPLMIQNQFAQDSSISDSSHVVEYQHNDRRWDWRLGYYDWGDDFRADLGFVNRVDFKHIVATVGHTWRWDGEGFFSRIRVAADYDRTEDQSGLQIEEETEFFLNMNGPMQSYLNGLFGGSETYWNGQYFDEQFNMLNIGFSPTPNLTISSLIRYEDVVDFANTRLGYSERWGPRVRYRFGRHFLLSVGHQYQDFESNDDHLFTANLTDIRATYQFDARSFIRLTVQYEDRERNQDNYIFPVDSRSRELGTQLLYSYKVNAATRFFLGYSDTGFEDDIYNSLEYTNRTFFAKFSYAWQP
ncbi:MAG: hydrolase [Pseudomonadales bacterium]|nr:hydrolase [Pseudomonadales bacterium]